MNRHDLALLCPRAQLHFLDQNLPTVVYQTIQHWVEQGIPMTICRQDHQPAVQVKLAMSCFIQARKYRIAFTVNPTDIIEIQSPVLLSQILQDFDLVLQAQLKKFMQSLSQLDCQVYVYGSYAHQYLTQLPYVSPSSDLDMLLYPTQYDETTITGILKQLHLLQSHTSQAIDGEIKIHPHWQVSFNELQFARQHGQTHVIAKGIQEIALLELQQLWEQSNDQYSACTS